MLIPWFPSSDGTTLESKQGIFDYRQTIKLAERGNEFNIISIKWRGQPAQEVIEDKIVVSRITPLFIFPQIRYPIPNLLSLNRNIKKEYIFFDLSL